MLKQRVHFVLPLFDSSSSFGAGLREKEERRRVKHREFAFVQKHREFAFVQFGYFSTI